MTDERIEAFGDTIDPRVKKSLENAIKIKEGVGSIAIDATLKTGQQIPITAMGSITHESYTGTDDQGIENTYQPESEYEYDLKDGDIMISTVNCGIICRPKNIGVEDNFIVLYLSKEERDRFVLYPGTRFVIYANTMNGTSGKFKVFYSGINFEYDDSVFTVFHTIKED